MSDDPRREEALDVDLDGVLEEYLLPEPAGDDTPTVRMPYETHLVACMGEAHEALRVVLSEISSGSLRDKASRRHIRDGVWRARALLQEAETILKASGEYPQVGDER